jgi:hypothetical protein
MIQELLGGTEERINTRMNASMAKFEEKLDACHEKRMVMLDAHHKRIMACLGEDCAGFRHDAFLSIHGTKRYIQIF